MFTSPIFITTVYTSGQRVPSFPTQNAESPSPSSSTSSIWNSGSNRTCLPGKYNNRNITSRLVMNVTRVVDGDLVVVPCRGRCGELCSNIGAIRIRCDLRAWPCQCKCASGTTFRTDTARCVNTFNGGWAQYINHCNCLPIYCWQIFCFHNRTSCLRQRCLFVGVVTHSLFNMITFKSRWLSKRCCINCRVIASFYIVINRSFAKVISKCFIMSLKYSYLYFGQTRHLHA